MDVQELVAGVSSMPRPHTKQSPRARSKEDAELGARLRALRKERGLSQGELAKRIGVDQRTISFYEIGFIRIPAKELIRMAGILKASLKEFTVASSVSSSDAKSRKIWKMVERIETLPPRQQKAIFLILDGVLSKHSSVSASG